MGMKSSTIKNVLDRKIINWLDTIGPIESDIRKLAAKNVIISGGAIASMLLGEKVNDYDVYFRTKEAAIAVANHYVNLVKSGNTPRLDNKFGANLEVTVEHIQNILGEYEDRVKIYIPSSGVIGDISELKDENPLESAEKANKVIRERIPYTPLYLTDNAITLSDKMQLVLRFYGEPSEILRNYDFAHAMCYYDFWNQELELPQEALQCMLSKTLIYKGSLYPVASILRVRKFIKRGWRITAGQMLKMIMQLQEVDLTNMSVLREQLIGVDQTYMEQLLFVLMGKDKERVDATYLASLVDELFE